MDHHTGGKWFIHGPKHRNENQLPGTPLLIIHIIACKSHRGPRQSFRSVFTCNQPSLCPPVLLSVCPSLTPFYTPVWKTDVLCYGNVRPSVRVFRTFFSTCFEISIWNLVYAFSRWHDMSSLSFITIGSFWPSLHPNIGQTQFLQ